MQGKIGISIYILNRVSHSPGCLQMCYVAKDDLELAILLPSTPHTFSGYRCPTMTIFMCCRDSNPGPHVRQALQQPSHIQPWSPLTHLRITWSRLAVHKLQDTDIACGALGSQSLRKTQKFFLHFLSDSLWIPLILSQMMWLGAVSTSGWLLGGHTGWT